MASKKQIFFFIYENEFRNMETKFLEFDTKTKLMFINNVGWFGMEGDDHRRNSKQQFATSQDNTFLANDFFIPTRLEYS